MEASPSITKQLDNEDNRDNNLAGEMSCGMHTRPSTDTTHVSNCLAKNEAFPKPFPDNGFGKSCFANGNDNFEASKLKRNPISGSTFSSAVGKNYVWRVIGSNGTSNGSKPLKGEANEFLAPMDSSKELPSILTELGKEDNASNTLLDIGRESNLAGEILGGMKTSPSGDIRVISNGLVESESSPKLSPENGFDKSCYEIANGDYEASRLNKKLGSMGIESKVTGKNYVWRVARSNGTPNGSNPLKEQNLGGMGTSPSGNITRVSNDSVESESSSKLPPDSGFGKSCYENGTRDSKALSVKKNPVSSVLGKNCVWRVVVSNGTPNGSNPLKVEANEFLAPVNSSEKSPLVSTGLDNEDNALKSMIDTNLTRTSPSGDITHVSNNLVKSETSLKPSTENGFGKSCYANGNNASKALKLEKKHVSSVLGKNCVWRVAGSNDTLNGSKPSKVEPNKVSAPVESSEESLLQRDANLNNEFENFLFEMLGQGFQLERSAIREVLGRCGYDMKRSLETLLNLAAVNLDRRNNFREGTVSHSNSRALSRNQVQIAESERRTMRTNGISPRKPEMISERQKENSTPLFHVPEKPGLTFSAPTLEPAEDYKDKATSSHHVDMKDDAEEDSYHILRKAVREHRDTMKGYYKAAAEAFASGDRARAGVLLEKGQFFYCKAREADEESGRIIFKISGYDGEMQNEMSLDLRLHDAKEAIRLVKCHLRSLSGIYLNSLKIMIGAGEQDVEKRKRIMKLLEKEGIKWNEDEKSGIILVRLDEINPKRLSFARK